MGSLDVFTQAMVQMKDMLQAEMQAFLKAIEEFLL